MVSGGEEAAGKWLEPHVDGRIGDLHFVHPVG